MIAYYADLYATYFRLLLKTRTQYRADFAITFACSICYTGSQLVFLTAIFANIGQLQGWSFNELLLIWGLMNVSGSLANTFLDVPHQILFYIRSGYMDRLMIRPPAPLFQMAGESGIRLQGLSGAVIGGAGMAIALAELGSLLPWWAAIYLTLCIVSGVFIAFSVQLILACLSFWVVNTFSLMQTISWMNQFGQYPVTILALPLQFLFTWVVPYAMMAFFPVAFLLRGNEYQVYGLLAPLMGFVFLGLALRTWQTAIGHYQSTGS